MLRMWQSNVALRALRQLHVSAFNAAFEVKMPSLSPTMSEGTIVKWAVSPGSSVAAGDVLCEIQTDKAVVALEADEDGVVAKLVKDSDSGTVKVGELIAVVAEEGEDWQEVASSSSSSSSDSGSSSGDESSDTESEESTESSGSVEGQTVRMPSLSPTMTEGTIVQWMKKEGEKVSAGDVLCEIQTDKAVVSMEWDDDAVLAKILVKEGESGISVGTLIALMVEEGEDWQDVKVPATKTSKKSSSSPPSEAPVATKKSKTGSVVESHHFEHLANVGPATMLLLAQYGLKAQDVASSGPKGLVKSDVLKYIEERKLKPVELKKAEDARSTAKSEDVASKQKVTTASKPTSGYTDHPLSSMRATIAARLSESKQTSPHGHATLAANINRLTALRRELMESGVKLSLNDFVIKACASALRHVPEINVNIVNEDIKMMPNIDISVAVATDSGLITPIVKDAVGKSVVDIASEIHDLAGRARQNKLQLHEFQGGTFTISNLGMFGIHEFTAIINPPQAAILAVGSAFPEVDAETFQPGSLMRATLSFDRRFIDEALACDFMSVLTKMLEQPEHLDLGLLPSARAPREALTII